MRDSAAVAGAFAAATRAARLRRWVVVIGLFAIVANVAVSAYDQWSSYRFAVANNSRELVNAARILAAQTAGSLKTVDVLLRDTADWYLHRGSKATLEAEAALAARADGLPQLLWISISDAQGIQRFRSRAPTRRNVDISDRPYFTAHRDNPTLGLYVSEPLVTRSERYDTIGLSRRLADDNGAFAGVVTGFMNLTKFQEFYRQINLGQQSAIFLVHERGALIAREPPIPERVGTRVPEHMTVADDSAMLVTSALDGVRRYVARARVDGFPLVIGVAREESAVLGPWRTEALRVAIRTAVLTLLIAAAIVALVRQLRRVELGERALRESEERYALAMEGANEGHFDWDLEGGRSFLSEKMKALFGLAPDAPITSRAELLASVDIHPDDGPLVDAAFQAHLAGHTPSYSVEYRVRHPDGEWHWLLVRGRSLRDAAGKAYRVVGSAIDVTERKRAESEKERLEIRLRRSQKMEAMGTLAGGIAHDFNNILGAILGYGELAQKNAVEGSVVRRYVDNVMHAGGRAKSLVERILAFSRSGLGERAPVNVQAVAEETLELLAASLRPDIRLVHKLDTGDAAVIGDATQLHQVLMNLCTNAVQAMPDGGELAVLLEREEVREQRALTHGELAPGPYARFTVRDTGTGIRPEVLDRMFDPFFTTKGVGQGTGLGLSLVHGIVADVGGAIDVASTPGQGTAFTVWLPLAGAAPRPASGVVEELPRGNGEVIMVVDDEPALVELAEEMLAELGYEPVGFRSSTAALESFAAAPHRFDAVMTDEMMPELTGSALALEIRKIRSDVPMIIMSGYVDASVAALARSAGVSEVLRKPLQARDIAEALAAVLPISQAASGGAAHR
ncbi:MAG: ATP-binding protein [Burkholderiales bacterium]